MIHIYQYMWNYKEMDTHFVEVIQRIIQILDINNLYYIVKINQKDFSCLNDDRINAFSDMK